MAQLWQELRPRYVSLNHRQPSRCLETPSSEAPRLCGAITRMFRETGGSRPLVVLSLAVLALGVMAPAAKAQTVIKYPRGVIGATGHITLENVLTSGSIHLNLSQCGWTF
jgi:hypothetical protein